MMWAITQLKILTEPRLFDKKFLKISCSIIIILGNFPLWYIYFESNQNDLAVHCLLWVELVVDYYSRTVKYTIDCSKSQAYARNSFLPSHLIPFTVIILFILVYSIVFLQAFIFFFYHLQNPGFDFSQAQFTGNCPDPRTFMGGISGWLVLSTIPQECWLGY